LGCNSNMHLPRDRSSSFIWYIQTDANFIILWNISTYTQSSQPYSQYIYISLHFWRDFGIIFKSILHGIVNSMIYRRRRRICIHNVLIWKCLILFLDHLNIWGAKTNFPIVCEYFWPHLPHVTVVLNNNIELVIHSLVIIASPSLTTINTHAKKVAITYKIMSFHELIHSDRC